jgi:hypothetical protein
VNGLNLENCPPGGRIQGTATKGMKLFHFLIVITFLPLFAPAAELTLEDISPHLARDAKIVWKAPTNSFPTTLWTYEKRPRNFASAVASNALALGEFKMKLSSKPVSKLIILWDRAVPGDPRPDYFTLDPNHGAITFRRQRRQVERGDSTSESLVKRTWEYAARLALDKTLLLQGEAHNSTVSLVRKLDGISFREDMQGFSVQYGDQGEIRSLALNWPTLKRLTQERVIRPDEIIQCIRAAKTPVLPATDESDYFARVKTLDSAQTLTITSITPYYVEGRFGEQPKDGESENFVEPVAELSVIVEWGNTNATVTIFAPLTGSDMARLCPDRNAQKP